MRKFLLIIILILFCWSLYGAELSNISSAFTNIGYGAKPMGMGGAYVSLARGANSLVWNPAGINNLDSQYELTVDNVTLLDLFNYSYLGLALPFKDYFSLGGGFVYSGDEAMSESVLLISCGVNGEFFDKPVLDNLNVGINLKYYGSSFGNNSDGSYIDDDGLEHQVSGSAHGYGFDLGLQYNVTQFSAVGIMWENLVNDIFWESSNETNTAKGNYDESIPTRLIMGYNVGNENFTFTLDYDKSIYSDIEDIIHTGGEYVLFDRYFSLRTGISQEIFTGDNRKYSFGIGTRLNIWQESILYFDAAYEIQTQWKGSNNLRTSLRFMK